MSPIYLPEVFLVPSKSAALYSCFFFSSPSLHAVLLMLTFFNNVTGGVLLNPCWNLEKQIKGAGNLFELENTNFIF